MTFEALRFEDSTRAPTAALSAAPGSLQHAVTPCVPHPRRVGAVSEGQGARKARAKGLSSELTGRPDATKKRRSCTAARRRPVSLPTHNSTRRARLPWRRGQGPRAASGAVRLVQSTSAATTRWGRGNRPRHGPRFIRRAWRAICADRRRCAAGAARSCSSSDLRHRAAGAPAPTIRRRSHPGGTALSPARGLEAARSPSPSTARRGCPPRKRRGHVRDLRRSVAQKLKTDRTRGARFGRDLSPVAGMVGRHVPAGVPRQHPFAGGTNERPPQLFDGARDASAEPTKALAPGPARRYRPTRHAAVFPTKHVVEP